jgi:hypothetical protein
VTERDRAMKDIVRDDLFRTVARVAEIDELHRSAIRHDRPPGFDRRHVGLEVSSDFNEDLRVSVQSPRVAGAKSLAHPLLAYQPIAVTQLLSGTRIDDTIVERDPKERLGIRVSNGRVKLGAVVWAAPQLEPMDRHGSNRRRVPCTWRPHSAGGTHRGLARQLGGVCVGLPLSKMQRGSGPRPRRIRLPASRCQLGARTPAKSDETGDRRQRGEGPDVADIQG